MQSPTQPTIPEELQHLAELHPDYSPLELREGQAQLRQYFDIAWKIFSRMERPESATEINLTTANLNPMVKPPSGSPTSNQDNR